ncbi:MAG: hypothetical protein IIY04_00625 [Oscillospiraceae bacterium]|nr:hypothetical protein [Oscillospiraceae bacterium]
MPNYQAMYLRLFNAVTDAIEILTKVQQDCEELYMSDDEPNLIVLPSDEGE